MCSDGLDISFVASQYGGSGGDGIVMWLRDASTSASGTALGLADALALLYGRSSSLRGSSLAGSSDAGLAGGLLALGLDQTGSSCVTVAPPRPTVTRAGLAATISAPAQDTMLYPHACPRRTHAALCLARFDFIYFALESLRLSVLLVKCRILCWRLSCWQQCLCRRWDCACWAHQR